MTGSVQKGGKEGDEMKVLIICTGNSCRSQMAAAYLERLCPEWTVRSAGTVPAPEVNPLAVRVMAEDGIDISRRIPCSVSRNIPEPWDTVIIVCDGARETCPVFTGSVRRRLHIGFDDPAAAGGSEDERLRAFRRVRDGIRRAMVRFAEENGSEG